MAHQELNSLANLIIITGMSGAGKSLAVEVWRTWAFSA